MRRKLETGERICHWRNVTEANGGVGGWGDVTEGKRKLMMVERGEVNGGGDKLSNE